MTTENINKIKGIETEIMHRKEEIMRLEAEITKLEADRMKIKDPPLTDFDFPKKSFRSFNMAGIYRLSELYCLLSGDYSALPRHI